MSLIYLQCINVSDKVIDSKQKELIDIMQDYDLEEQRLLAKLEKIRKAKMEQELNLTLEQRYERAIARLITALQRDLG